MQKYIFPDSFVTGDIAPCSYTVNRPAPLFRKIFSISDPAEKAELVIGVCGFYELYLNGSRITRGYLSPYIANPRDILFYDHYDLTGLLETGLNELCILLGNGPACPIGGEVWGHRDNGMITPCLALQFQSSSLTFSGKDLVWKPSGLLFNDCRCGTFFDARLENPADYLPSEESLADPSWLPVIPAEKPEGIPAWNACEPVQEIRRLQPVGITAGPLREYRVRDGLSHLVHSGPTAIQPIPLQGGYIYDFGENAAGVPILQIHGKAGQQIDLQFSELLFEGFVDYINVDVYPNGYCQRDTYICRGDETEIYIPPFTYHGFRYCYVYGITPEQAGPDLLQHAVLSSNVPVLSDFHCSDPVSNRIYEACCRSDRSNLYGIITDCPTREKNGWTGDAAVSADHFCMTLGVSRVMAQWLQCIRLAQSPAGNLPQMVPSANHLSDTPVWDSVLVFLPYSVYQYTGDTRIIRENMEAIRRNLSYYLGLRDERGIVECGLGDWIPVESLPSEYASPLGFCVSLMLAEECRMAAVLTEAIGEDPAFYQTSREELLEAVRREYTRGGVVHAGLTAAYRKPTYRPCQTSQVLGLVWGLFRPEDEAEALQTLLDLIHAKNDSFDCGFLGLRYLFHVLSSHGYTDLCYKMITKPDFPSYANMIYRGETTVWERFMSPGKRIGSHNHHFMGCVSAWYLQEMCGIHVNPEMKDPNAIFLSPHFPAAVQEASGSYTTAEGSVKVHWFRTSAENAVGSVITLHVETDGAFHVQIDPSIDVLLA